MLSDAYSKVLLTVIAGSCVLMAYQSVVARDFPDYPEPCGSLQYYPCYVVAAEPEGLRIASGDGGVGEEEPVRVTMVD